MPKQKKHLKKAELPISAASLAAPQTERSMTYWLERISPIAVAQLWSLLKVRAKAAPSLTSLGLLENGITIPNPASQVAVTALTMADGFVLFFTEKDTST